MDGMGMDSSVLTSGRCFSFLRNSHRAAGTGWTWRLTRGRCAHPALGRRAEVFPQSKAASETHPSSRNAR